MKIKWLFKAASNQPLLSLSGLDLEADEVKSRIEILFSQSSASYEFF